MQIHNPKHKRGKKKKSDEFSMLIVKNPCFFNAELGIPLQLIPFIFPQFHGNIFNIFQTKHYFYGCSMCTSKGVNYEFFDY